MIIQYASDLHLEFSDNSRYLREHPLEVNGDILLLAGDIGYLGDDNYQKHPFWSWAADNYQQVIVIPGNHEFYAGFDLGSLQNGWQHKIRTNVTCYYNAVIRLENIDLIVSTLWSQINLNDSFATESAVTDFKRIKLNGTTLDWVHFNEEHYRCFNFLNESIKNSSADHIVVATHHVPSFELMSPEFKDSNLNGAFVIELGGFIAASPVEYWIYGHSHRNIDALIGKVQCVSNQLGYVFANEHRTFSHTKCIEVM